MGYINPIFVVAVFIFAWFSMYDSRPMTEKQITMLKRNMEKWESAPRCDKICEGKVWRKNNVTTFKFTYDSPSGAFCEAEYKIKVDKSNLKSTHHKFECTMVPEEDPEEPDFE